MTKITITLTLTDEDAETLVETLKVGADHRFAPSLARDSRTIAEYVERRKDAAILARGRARRRADQIKILEEASASRTRASVTADQRASNDRAFASLAEDAAALLRSYNITPLAERNDNDQH